MKSMQKLFALLCLFTLLVVAQEKPGCEHAKIHGATFGTVDITNRVDHEYNTGVRDFDASATKWGSTFTDGNIHTLTIVYEKCGNLALQTAAQGAKISLP